LQYACCQQLGVVFGFFFNYGITRHHQDTQLQWQLPTALQLVPAVIWGAGAFFCPESPRFLLAQNKPSEALRVLAGLRGLPEDHPYVQAEFHGTEQQLNHELEAVAGASQLDLLKETFSTLENRRRFVLMFMAHLFAQWSGANAITQYSPTIFGYLGIAGEEKTFLATGIYAIVKFTSTLLVAVFVIDFIGRRRSLMTGISLQIITLVFVGAYLGATTGKSASDIANSASASSASMAAIVAIYIHAVAWSMGWFSIPYLVSAEVFPVRIRGLCVSILMAAHWAFYFACSRAMPSLLVATHRYGAFAFFGSICIISLAYVFVAMPETSGRSLESMDKLFQRPWYTVWKVAYPRPEDLAASQYSRRADDLEEELDDSEDKPYKKANHVEVASS
jgi:sugar porter (SP) family MFS transporter